MKRSLRTLLVAFVLVAALAVSAFAAEFTNCADALNELGMFKGTAGDYQLDREPTRIEAGVMLVRLLGKEAEAQALADKYTAPFDDVKPWAYGYVQYLYDNGLSAGQVPGKFGSDAVCKDKDYATFLLRALGYSDKDGDFTWAESVSKARELGVIDELCAGSRFLRDNMAAWSYEALAANVKESDETLLGKLVADGAIADDKGYGELFQTIRYLNSLDAADTNALSGKLDALLDLTIGEESIQLSLSGPVAVEANEKDMDKSKMSMDLTIGIGDSEESASIPVKAYYSDGKLYVDMDGEKVASEMSLQEIVASAGVDLDSMGHAKVVNLPLCLLDELAVVDLDKGGKQYTMYLSNDFAGSLLDTVVSTAADMYGQDAAELAALFQMLNVKFTDLCAWVSVNKDALTGMGGTVSLTMDLGEDSPMGADISFGIDELKTGVKVALPTDLAGYPAGDPISFSVSEMM